MSTAPELTLHAVPNSHPVEAVVGALDAKGLAFERVDLPLGPHIEQMQEIYGEGRTTVPGLLVDGEPVHGSHAIFARLDEISPEVMLYPPAIADAVREVDEWADDAFQETARFLVWGALHFRPEHAGTFAGAGPLDPAGTDFAIAMLRRIWKHKEITAQALAERLQALPADLDRVDELAEQGIVGGEEPNAADLQIGSSVRLMQTIGDVRPLLAGRAAERIASAFFSAQAGDVPAGAFPPSWLPAPDAATAA